MRHLIVISCLQKVDSIGADEVHNAVLLGETTRPSSSSKVFQWLRFTDPLKRISQDSFDKSKRSQGYLAIYFNPKPQIFAEL